MKKAPLLAAVTAILSLKLAASEPQAILAFDFNADGNPASTGTVQVEGAVLGSAEIGTGGSGVSGRNDDRAFINPSATSADSDGILQLPDVAEVRGLAAMTFVVWYRYNDGAEPGLGERLGDFGSNWLFFFDAPNRLMAQVPTGGPGQSAPNNSYNVSGWVFAAFTFDHGTETVTYFRGSAGERVVNVSSRRSFAEPMNNVATPLQFGNNNARNRAFPGALDALKIFDRVLTLEELEAIRLADLKQ